MNGPGATLPPEIAAALDDLTPSAIALRQRLHSDPELGGTEERTVEKLLDFLSPDEHSRVAEGFFMVTGTTGPMVGVRAELDALAVQEDSGNPHGSQNAGVAHLCGHDVHMAALALTTQVIARTHPDVRVVSLFQPREETVPSGAVDVVADRAFSKLPLSAMLGFHLQPVLTARTFSALPGAVNAAADEFTIVVTGEPSHGAYPQLARDPVVAAAHLISAAQTLISRESDPMEPSVLTFGRVSGGETHNAIPRSVQLDGTIRSYSQESRDRLHEGLRRVAAGVALTGNVDIEVEIGLGEPVLFNDGPTATKVSFALENAGFGRGKDMRSCGADDFSYYSELFPSTMVFVGTGTQGASGPGLHHPSFAPADRSIRDVAEMMLTSVLALARDEAPE